MNKKQKVVENLANEARKTSPWSPRSLFFYLLAIIYVISPIDFVPDAMLGIGQIDDTAVLIAIIWYVIRLLRRRK